MLEFFNYFKLNELLLKLFVKEWEEYQASSRILNGECTLLNDEIKKYPEKGIHEIFQLAVKMLFFFSAGSPGVLGEPNSVDFMVKYTELNAKVKPWRKNSRSKTIVL